MGKANLFFAPLRLCAFALKSFRLTASSRFNFVQANLWFAFPSHNPKHDRRSEFNA
jgi:hypothetical protein